MKETIIIIIVGAIYALLKAFVPDLPLDKETFIALIVWIITKFLRLQYQDFKAFGKFGRKYWK